MPLICANNCRHRKQCVPYVSCVEMASVFTTLVQYGANYDKMSLFPDVGRLSIHSFYL